MPDTTTKGFPFPEGPDDVDVAGDVQTLAEYVDTLPGIASLTSAQLSALTAPEKWAGRLVWNSTTARYQFSNGSTFADLREPVVIAVTVSGEANDLTTGTAKATFRLPYAMTLTGVRASLSTASTSGNPTFDVNENGTTILSTKLSIDANEKTSTTAATPPVISDTALADDAEITVDCDVAGTGARGAKVYLIGVRA